MCITKAYHVPFQPPNKGEPGETSTGKGKTHETTVDKEKSLKHSNIEEEAIETEEEAEKEDTLIIPKKLLSNLHEEAERLHNELMKSLGKQDTNGSPFRVTTGATSDKFVRNPNLNKVKI